MSCFISFICSDIFGILNHGLKKFHTCNIHHWTLLWIARRSCGYMLEGAPLPSARAPCLFCTIYSRQPFWVQPDSVKVSKHALTKTLYFHESKQFTFPYYKFTQGNIIKTNQISNTTVKINLRYKKNSYNIFNRTSKVAYDPLCSMFFPSNFVFA